MKDFLFPASISNRRRQRLIRTLAAGQISTNDRLLEFLTRGFWGRVRWLFFGL